MDVDRDRSPLRRCGELVRPYLQRVRVDELHGVEGRYRGTHEGQRRGWAMVRGPTCNVEKRRNSCQNNYLNRTRE